MGTRMEKGEEMETGTAVFEHERLHVFVAARAVFETVAPWLKRTMPHEVRSQLLRSSVSIMSNIAEGAGKTAAADKRRSYEYAKGSALETAAQIEIIKILGVIKIDEYTDIRKRLLDIARMLHGLCGGPRRA